MSFQVKEEQTFGQNVWPVVVASKDPTKPERLNLDNVRSGQVAQVDNDR